MCIRDRLWHAHRFECMRLHTGVYGHHKRVCNESWLWEKNPLLHQGIKPALAACWSDAVPLSYILTLNFLNGFAAVCEAGQTISSAGVCNDCPNDFYQDVTLPDQNTNCTYCGNGRGTMLTKQTSESDCKRESVGWQVKWIMFWNAYLSLQTQWWWLYPCLWGFWENVQPFILLLCFFVVLLLVF